MTKKRAPTTSLAALDPESKQAPSASSSENEASDGEEVKVEKREITIPKRPSAKLTAEKKTQLFSNFSFTNPPNSEGTQKAFTEAASIIPSTVKPLAPILNVSASVKTFDKNVELAGLNKSLSDKIIAILSINPSFDLSNLFPQYTNYFNEICKKSGNDFAAGNLFNIGSKDVPNVHSSFTLLSSNTIENKIEKPIQNPISFQADNAKVGFNTASLDFGLKSQSFQEGKEIPKNETKLEANPIPNFKSSENSQEKPVFSFGESFQSKYKSTDATNQSENGKTEEKKPIFTFGSKTDSMPSFKFGSGNENIESKDASSAKIFEQPVFNFGSKIENVKNEERPSDSMKIPSFAVGNEMKSMEKPMTFNFGASETKTTPSAFNFNFGTPNKVGNGSKPETPTPFTFPSGGFSFSPIVPTGKAENLEEGKTGNEDGDENTIPVGSEDSFTCQRDSKNLEKGEGEENENILFSDRCKLYTFKEKTWEDLGVILVKINQNNSTGKKRILGRVEGSGKLVLNSYIIPPSTKSSKEGSNVVMITLTENGKPVGYKLRFKTAEQIENFNKSW